ncbi:MAG: hypothetical protein LC731_08640, partial [Acidobacteria bacterium]|nr:hypothetical protein [Acidobacteriota bacterium]
VREATTPASDVALPWKRYVACWSRSFPDRSRGSTRRNRRAPGRSRDGANGDQTSTKRSRGGTNGNRP